MSSANPIFVDAAQWLPAGEDATAQHDLSDLAQTLTGSLVGAGGSQGWGRVRWGQVGTIIVAWGVTLPLAFTLAAAAGLLTGRML